MNFWHIIVPANWQGLTIDHVLKNIWQAPRLYIHELRMAKGIYLNDTLTTWNTVLQAGDKLSILNEEKDDTVATPRKIEVCFEDEHILVVNKNVGVNVHPTTQKDNDSLVNYVKDYMMTNQEFTKPRHVHRLDKDTSGTIIFAKHHLAGALLDRQLERHEVKREYIAAVRGKISSGTINAPIGKDRNNSAKRVVAKTGQHAITHYTCMNYNIKENISLVRLQLETGRTHQIRVHLSHIGYPVIGDTLYEGIPSRRMMLHASEVVFIHPFTNEKKSVQAAYSFFK